MYTDQYNFLYAFQEIYKIDEISKDYKENVISVVHTTPGEGQIMSAIHLNFDKQRHIYRCEFVLKDYSICFSTFSVTGKLLQSLSQDWYKL